MTAIDLEDVARLVGGRIAGDPHVRVRGVAPLAEAGEDQLGLLADRRYLPALAGSRSGAVLVSSALADALGGRTAVVVDDAHAALPVLLAHFHPPSTSPKGVHPTAVLGAGVRLGEGASVGPYAVIEEGVQVGERVRIGAHAVLGRGAVVGDDSVLHPHVVLYPEVRVGRRVVIHAGARIGSDGFGYVPSGEGYRKVPQVGGCALEDDVEIGANTCIDRGSIGDTTIGRGTKLDNLVHIGHNVRVGEDCAMAAQVGIAGSTRIGRGAIFGGQSGAGGHIEVGAGARISAKGGAIKDVAEGQTVAGYPARDVRSYMKATALLFRLPELLKRLGALERRLGLPDPAAPPPGRTELD